MKSKTAVKIVAGLFVLVVVVTGLVLYDETDPKGNRNLDSNQNFVLVIRNLLLDKPKHELPEDESVMSDYLAEFERSMDLYGRVIDQYGDPVAGATIRIYPADNPFGDQSRRKQTLMSDASGGFSVRGIKGAGAGVQVEKVGYLYLSPLGGPSSSASVYPSDGKGTGNHYSDPASPLVMKLHKIGPVEPQFYMENTRWRLRNDGTPQWIALDSKSGEGTHGIEFRLWSDTHIRDQEGYDVYSAFDWTFEARIPGGGFIWNDSKYNFTAPESGYKESIRYHYPASLPREKWKRFQSGRYFVRFADGTFARIQIDIDAGSENRPLSMTSWLSLKPGSTNLATPYVDGSDFHGGDPEAE